MSTLAKLYASDRWIVLDDVQFARRDYQHRARLAALDDPDRHHWLTLPTHLPHGRRTLINEALLAEPHRSRRTVSLLIRQFYGRSRHWPALSDVLEVVIDRFGTTDRVADLARTSTIALLTALGWRGEVLDSSTFQTRRSRSERLADLAVLTGSTHYLCGTGGLRYLDHQPFAPHGIPVVPFHTSENPADRLWHRARRVSSLWAMSEIGPAALATRLAAEREAHLTGGLT